MKYFLNKQLQNSYKKYDVAKRVFCHIKSTMQFSFAQVNFTIATDMCLEYNIKKTSETKKIRFRTINEQYNKKVN